MKKIILLFASALLSLGVMAQTVAYNLTTTHLTSGELNQKTEETYIAIKNLSSTNSYYFVGNTNAAPYSKANFSDEAVFVWTPVQEGMAGSYYLKKLDGTYMQQSSPKDFGAVANAAVFTTTNPTSQGNGSTKFNGDSDSQSYINGNDDANLVRFVKGNNWINVQNGNSGTPAYNTGLGGWTIHYVYMVETAESGPEPEPEPTIEHTFSADKVYYIQWKNTSANYITENRDKSLTVADKKNSKYQFWRLIPVEDKSHCYTIQNVVTENFLGTCNMTPSSSSRVNTSTTAVEYYIGATTGNGDIAGCHYFSSTDCENYADETAAPRALNKDGASSYIITWQAGTDRTGSYWKIVETDEEYQAPEPPAHTEQTKNLTVYFRPCGMVGNTYLTAATIDGIDPVVYTATAKPSSFHVPYSKDHGAVLRGSTFNVSITLNSNTDTDLKANAYFDWNADGEFETMAPISLLARTTTATAEVTVPDDAVSGNTRMRIRLNSNGLDRADDDVEGFVYDIPFAVVDAITERKVLVDVNSTNLGTVALSANAESYAIGTQLTATATPKGNATFDSWREGGVVVSRDANYTFGVENHNMTLKAYFTPNTEVEEPEEPEVAGTPAMWDFTFTRTSTTEATVAVTRNGEVVEGVTATIAIAGATEYQNANQTASNKNILCINRNTDGATEANPNKYTLTINNTTDEAFAFSYIEIFGVGVTGQGGWQSAQAPRKRYFKVKHGDTTLEPRVVSINDAQHCNGTETVNGFEADGIVVPAGATYTIELDIYNASNITGEEAKGCFYGLTKIALTNEYTLTVSPAGYATLYLDYAVAIPENVEVYIAKTVQGDRLMMTQMTDVLPAYTGVIVRAPEGTYRFVMSDETPADVEGNLLEGTTSEESIVADPDYKYYVLSMMDDVVGMYLAKIKDNGTFLNNANKAYLALDMNKLGIFDDETDTSNQLSNRLRFDFGGTTAIDNPEIRNHNSVIIYDLTGRRVMNTEKLKGIYIVNGKNVILK